MSNSSATMVKDERFAMKSFDERDTLFARLRLKEGTKEYDEYYQRNPACQEADEAVRRLPHKLNYPPIVDDIENATDFFSFFNKIEDEREVAADVVEMPKEQRTRLIKEVAKYYGAVAVGVAQIKPEQLYSFHGSRSNYGIPVDKSFSHAIVLAAEVDKVLLSRAPHIEASMATVKAYRDVAFTGANLALFIRSQGFRTFLNSVARYSGPMVPMAKAAGLGQIGLHKMLVTREFGARVRLGAVLTDMPLKADGPVDFGLNAFCEKCGLCAKRCVGRAISKETDFDEHKCIKAWKKMGTDCGVCMITCPFSQGVDDAFLTEVYGQESSSIIEERFGRRPYIEEPLPIVKWSKI